MKSGRGARRRRKRLLERRHRNWELRQAREAVVRIKALENPKWVLIAQQGEGGLERLSRISDLLLHGVITAKEARGVLGLPEHIASLAAFETRFGGTVDDE